LAAQSVIHISDVRSFKGCRQRWHFSSRLRLGFRSGAPQKNLWLGSGVHDALEVYYEQKKAPRDPQVMFNAYINYLSESYDRFDELPMTGEHWEAIHKSASLGWGMLEHYARWAERNDNFEVILPEVSFSFPIPFVHDQEVYFGGRADGWVKIGNDYWLLEHKTAKNFPDMSLLFLDEQCVAYQWAAQVDPRFEGRRPKGTIYTFLLKEVPTVPRQLKSGGLSKASSMRTTYEVYKSALDDLGLPTTFYGEILQRLRSQPNPFFYRTHIERSPQALAVFGAELIATIREMLDPATVIYPSPNWFSCRYCTFRTPCQLVRNGVDPMPYLRSEFMKVEPHLARWERRRAKGEVDGPEPPQEEA